MKHFRLRDHIERVADAFVRKCHLHVVVAASVAGRAAHGKYAPPVERNVLQKVDQVGFGHVVEVKHKVALVLVNTRAVMHDGFHLSNADDATSIGMISFPSELKYI